MGCFFSCFDTEDGFSALSLTVALVIGCGLFLSSISAYTYALGQAGKTYQAAQAQKKLEAEFSIVASNPDLCTATLKVSGYTFTMAPFLAPDAKVNNNLAITALNIQNSSTQPDGSIIADFQVKAKLLRDENKTITFSKKLKYAHSGSTVTQCALLIDEKEACLQMGNTWSSGENRCRICESLGGTWQQSVCSL